MLRRMRNELFLACLSLALLVGCEQKIDVNKMGLAKGTINVLDQSGDTGYYVALDVDTKDRLHFVYADKQHHSLRYGLYAHGKFNAEVVDSTCKLCSFATILVSAGLTPHIAYYNDVSQTLLYAYRKENKWYREQIEWGQQTGKSVRLLIDAKQQLHALYYSGDGFLKHAWRVANPEYKKKAAKALSKATPEGLWGTQTVEKANGSEKVAISFVSTPDGLLSASFFQWSGLSSQLKMAHQDKNGHWVTQIVASEHYPGKSSALFYDRLLEPQIIFREALKDRLAVAATTPAGWKITPLVDGAYNMSLAADNKYNLVVAYEKLRGRDPRKGYLRMVQFMDGRWSDFEIDKTPGSGTYLDCAITSARQPVVAYFQETEKALKLFVGE